MFSIIIPLYNKASYIEKCLLSIACQTYRDFEVIVVNDGSTDESLEKVLHFRNTKFQVLQVINQPNQGVSIARNLGVEYSKSELIAFLDADDWWEPTFLEHMKELILAFPEAGVYGSGYYSVKNTRKKIEPIAVDSSFTQGIINYCHVYAKNLCMPLWTGATVIRKSVFEEENGFNPVLKLGEDFDLWIRVALRYPVVFLNMPLANYNQDVELSGRAVGNMQHPYAHMIWNLDYLATVEKSNSELKQLLDNLRVYNLLPYFLNPEYRELAIRELDKVDWGKQPLKEKLRYNTPVAVLKLLRKVQIVGSKIKQSIIRIFVYRANATI